MLKKILKKIILSLACSFIIGSISYAIPSEKKPSTPPQNAQTQDLPCTNEELGYPKIDETVQSYTKPIKTSATTLNQIVREAISTHPNIAADKHALSAADDVIVQAAAGYMPTVDMRISLGRDNIRRNFATNSLNPLGSAGTLSTTRTDPSITIRQILFDGMGNASRIDKARSQRNQAHGNLGVTSDTTTVDAASATIDLRRLQRLERIANNNIHFHEVMREKVAEIVEAGATSISELIQVEARLHDTHIARANIISDLEVARAKFIEATGKEPPSYIKRIRLPAYLMPHSSEAAVRMALENNSSIKVAKSNIQIAESTHRETTSRLVPTVTLELEGERDRNMNATTGFQNRLTAMVVARHNLFNGGADFARSRETTKRLTEAHARFSLARRQTERSVRAAWGEAKNSRVKSGHLTNLIHEKRALRDTYLTEFTLGKRSLIDLLDAANDVFITEATRTSVDATTDINTVVVSVGTGQFARYIEGKETSEDMDALDSLDVIDPQDSVYLTPYKGPSKKSPGGDNVKSTTYKRKSIFEQRKEERQNLYMNKASA